MNLTSWLIVLIPLLGVLGFAIYSTRFVRGIADYLAAGRVAGRYVLSVSDMETGLGVVILIAMLEQQYQCGLGLSFWSQLWVPVSMVMALTGYCIYRFRETRSLSLGQFLEMRYSRKFRIAAASLRTISEMMTNAIGPAVAARFFIYFLGFPHEISVFGWRMPTFALVLAVVIFLALVVIWCGGRVALLVTDCIQGLMSYPIFVIFTVFILTRISFVQEVAPLMLDRASGESFLNPFDLEKLRDFNLFALFVTILGNVLNRASWIGNDTSGAARTPHEQKMAGIFGTWRNGFGLLMGLLLGISIFTFMNHANFSGEARQIRLELVDTISAEVVPDPAVREELGRKAAAIPEIRHRIGVDEPMSRLRNPDARYLDTTYAMLADTENGNAIFQKFRTLYYQMMLPVAMRTIFPPVLMGFFCLLMALLMLSTDDSRIFNASATIVQDIIMPLRGKPFDKAEHFRYLRGVTVGVCCFFFCVSLFMAQLDYIYMFTMIMTSLWLGGAGPIMIFGLYSRFGTTAGAWASLICGSGCSVAGLLLQRNWADVVYPLLDRLGWVPATGRLLGWLSGPLQPYVVWEMDPVKFPINSREIYCAAMLLGIAGYVVVSLLTCRKPFNLEAMLHRNSEAAPAVVPVAAAGFFRRCYDTFLGITPEYTRGDKFITWLVLAYSLGYQFLLSFVGVLVWRLFAPLPPGFWVWYFYINSVVIALVIGSISTVWFFIGGLIDIRRLFRDLAARQDDPLDDGWVEGHDSRAAHRPASPSEANAAANDPAAAN